jgi:prepilin signal peptidase PulO-like enzyme (type II secretory pathway)
MAFLFALLGLLVGGLVNRLGTDLPTRRRVTRPQCPYCGQNRPWWQWVSLPSYTIGHAKCPYCGAPIRLRYPLVELGLAVAYTYLWVLLGASIQLPLYLVYTAVFAIVLITDFERRLILNAVMYPAILFAAAAGFITPRMTWWSALVGGGIAFIFFLIVGIVGNAVFGAGALGGGDVKLALFVGLITGFPLVVEAIVLTIIIGAVISGFLFITRLRTLHDYVPYGPFLVAGGLITLLWGYAIAEWYMYR